MSIFENTYAAYIIYIRSRRENNIKIIDTVE